MLLTLSFGEAKMELFDYIEVFYNQRRRYSTLGQISPAEFEKRTSAQRMDPVENRQERGFPTGSTRINLLSLENKPEPAAINLRQPSTESDQGQRDWGPRCGTQEKAGGLC